MSKLDAKVFSSITPFSKQWILGDELMYEFLNSYQDFLSTDYGIVDLGSLEWNALTSQSHYRMSSASIVNIIKAPADNNTKADIQCSKYMSFTANEVYLENVGISIDNTGRVSVYDTNYNEMTSVAAFKSAMSGVYLIFELKDNIGRVEMSHLTWQRNVANPGGFSVPGTEMQTLGIKQGLCNLYCSKLSFYSGSFSWDIFADVPNKSIAKNVGNYALYAKDTDYTVAADFKASLANTYLYYEKA